MNLASDEWRVSSSIDISIKYFLPRSARAFRRCNLNVMVRTGPNLKSTWSSSSIFVYKDRQYFLFFTKHLIDLILYLYTVYFISE